MSLIAKQIDNVNEEEEKPKIEWSREQEELLAVWADKALCYRWLHDLAEKKFTRLNNSIQIPVIILSTLTGATNVGIDSIFPVSMKQYANIGIGVVSIATGIITTVGNFLRYAQNMEGHRVASVHWSKFHRNISVEVALHPDQRQDPVEFLTVCRAELDRLVEQSPSMPDDIIARFEARFKDVQISKPEICNSLETTKIYKPSTGLSQPNTPKTPDKSASLTNKIFSGFKKQKKIEITSENKSNNKPDNKPDNKTDSSVESVIVFDNNTPKPKLEDELNLESKINSKMNNDILNSLNK